MTVAIQDKPDTKTTETKTENKEKLRNYSPNVNVFENAESLVFHFEMPGVDESTVDIVLEKDSLIVEGKFKENLFEKGNATYLEFKEGNYYRKFTLGKPVDSEKTKAKIKNGFLELTLPKIEPKKKKVEIEQG
ncbi:Hsp20/alpha crystallin family protein [Leptospira sp. 'Mane']|uniref:Hsp20/alpha crystallin family protein n=1 Tax=Leptospira sp. 'Mane' TaxID=3387407 RepID=UPI00398B6278